MQSEHVIARQTVFHCVVSPLVAIESCQSASPGARPHRAFGIHMQGDDVVGIECDVHVLQTHFLFLAGMMLRVLRGVVDELNLVFHQLVGRAQPILVIPIGPPALLIASQPSFRCKPDFAVVAFVQGIDPIVGQSALSGVDCEQLPLAAIV